MKVQQLALSFWPVDALVPLSPFTSSSSSHMISLNRIIPLVPCKLAPPPSAASVTPCTKITPSLDVRSFDFPKPNKCSRQKPDAETVVPSCATRWNPMPAQIEVLEVLYQSGMRTPSAKQIEDITAELGKYGRIEGKNVFYWFQNHKARERQKQKRSALLALTTNNGTRPNSLLDLKLPQQEREDNMREKKRRCRCWCTVHLGLQLQHSGSGGHVQTLELFPLHPERK